MQNETTVVVWIGSQDTGTSWVCEKRIVFNRVPCIGESFNIVPESCTRASIDNVVWHEDGSAEMYLYLEEDGLEPGSRQEMLSAELVEELRDKRYKIKKYWNGRICENKPQNNNRFIYS